MSSVERRVDKELLEFLRHADIHSLSVTDRLIAIIWWHHNNEHLPVEFSQIQAESNQAGFPAINASREKRKLREDKRISSLDKGASFRLTPSSITPLSKEYSELVEVKKLPKSDAVFEQSAFKGTRGYIEKVVQQINVSYDNGLYDCCAVMVRRLLETMIIEVYEKLSRANELKGTDGHFLMFSGLLNILENDKSLNIGRQSLEGLKSFKKIADSSAHNRRFNASRKDISEKFDGVRLAVCELRQIAFDK